MVIDFQTPTLRDTATIEEEAPPRPSISVIEEKDPFLRTGRSAMTELGTEAGSGEGAMSETVIQKAR